MAEGKANNALRIRLHGLSLLQTEDNCVLSDSFNAGRDLHYPNLTNAQANYISTQIEARLMASLVEFIEELAGAKAKGLDVGDQDKSGPASG